jgi:hypothetical protein
MEPLLIDKLINRIENRGCMTTHRELAQIRKEIDKLVCENIHSTWGRTEVQCEGR